MKKIVLLAAVCCLTVLGIDAQRPNNTTPTTTEKKTVDNSERRSAGYQTNGRPSQYDQRQQKPAQSDRSRSDYDRVQNTNSSKSSDNFYNRNNQPRQDRFNGQVRR